ncbi:MAG: IS3 family transposase [Thermoplasmataceae archaeon]
MTFYFHSFSEHRILPLINFDFCPIIRKTVQEICSERVTYGYRRIWAMLRNEGIYLNPKDCPVNHEEREPFP